jgi:hypothetical protein
MSMASTGKALTCLSWITQDDRLLNRRFQQAGARTKRAVKMNYLMR